MVSARARVAWIEREGTAGRRARTRGLFFSMARIDPHPSSQDPSSSLPFRATPHDALRLGLPAYKEAAAGPAHPAEAIARAAPLATQRERLATLASVYGAGAAARESMEKQILTR